MRSTQLAAIPRRLVTRYIEERPEFTLYILNERATLSEPPVTPNANEPANENPFAPSFAGTFGGGAPRVHLDTAYWIAVTVLFIGVFVMFLSSFPLRWAAVVLCGAAAIRVPLLQRRHYRVLSDDVQGLPSLPSPLALLFTSLAFSLLFLTVSFIAFMTVCIPATIAFGLSDLNFTVLRVSILAGVLCFCGLLILSLRLRV